MDSFPDPPLHIEALKGKSHIAFQQYVIFVFSAERSFTQHQNSLEKLIVIGVNFRTSKPMNTSDLILKNAKGQFQLEICRIDGDGRCSIFTDAEIV